MISIIIPVLNESESIEDLLVHLTENASKKKDAEILVIDGGSSDTTTSIVTRFAERSTFPILLIHSLKGRAKQMNTGARAAKGSILYFLHADSFPPKNFDSDIVSEVEKGNLAGCFSMKFDSNHWWLQLMGWFTKFSWRISRGGDQSQFITKDLFTEIGGFDESYIIYEDNILINELYARNEFTVLPNRLTTSARLYHEKGVWTIQYHFLVIYFKKWMGADAAELHAYYCSKIRRTKKDSKAISQKAFSDK